MATNIDIIKDLSNVDYITSVVKNEFKKVIIENAFYKNKTYLIKNSTQVPFINEWNFNPQKCAYEQYGIKELYPIIMLVNNVSSFFDFHVDKFQSLIIPSIDAITFIAYEIV